MTLATHEVPWSAEQREWLQALGHDVLALALAPAGAAAALVPEPHEDRAAAKPRTTAHVQTTSTAPPLLRALARAAGRDEPDSELLAVLPDLATLRGSPAARRALWPQLRTLRKRTPR